MANPTGYELSRDWFNWCFENPDIVKPTHTALYFFAIEHCNRLGWKEKFGLPTQMTMDALGIKNWRTYSKSFNDIESWGFFKVIERSKNQYSATVIAIVKNTKATTKALSKATQSHGQKHYISIVGIDKQIQNNTEQIQEPITETHEVFKNRLLENELEKESIEINTREELGEKIISEFNSHLINESKHHSHYSEWKKHLIRWIPKRFKPPATKSKDMDRVNKIFQTNKELKDEIDREYGNN